MRVMVERPDIVMGHDVKKPYRNKRHYGRRVVWDKVWPYFYLGRYIKKAQDKKMWIHDIGGTAEGKLGWSEQTYRTLHDVCVAIEEFQKEVARKRKVEKRKHLRLVQ